MRDLRPKRAVAVTLVVRHWGSLHEFAESASKGSTNTALEVKRGDLQGTYAIASQPRTAN